MWKILKALWLYIFKPSKKVKAHILDSKYRVVVAFNFMGEDYYQFDSAFDLPTGRAMAALTIYDELRMKCDKEYLEMHIKAVEHILSGGSTGKTISIQKLAVINNNLKERVNLVPFPDYIYKLASVTFFTKEESPYNYDPVYNDKKITKWKGAPGTLDFFLRGPLKGLIPYLPEPGPALDMYLKTAQAADQLHQSDLRTVLSKRSPINGTPV